MTMPGLFTTGGASLRSAFVQVAAVAAVAERRFV